VRSASRSRWRIVAWTLAVALVIAVAGPQAQRGGAPVSGPVPTEAEIERAVQAVKADPNFATQRTMKILQWHREPPQGMTRPTWLSWLAGLVRWIEQSGRMLIWMALAVLAALLAGYIARTIRSWDPPEPAVEGDALPTHVQDLDIRPETLPHDIGAAARRLWDRGDHRAALALLYRGLLSRLVHVHELPIRDSSTEADCLALAGRLGAAGRDYSARLIAVWQAAVYGQVGAPTAVVHGLCDDFASALVRPPTGSEG